MLQYIIGEYTIEFERPMWWDEIELTSDELNCDNISGRYATDQKLWKRYFKILMNCEQKKSKVPYQLFHVAKDIGDQKLTSGIGIGILNYHRSINSEEAMHDLCVNISDSFIEQEKIEQAKDYLKKATVVINSQDSYQTHYASVATRKLKQLEKITDTQDYFLQRADFRNTLSQVLRQLNLNLLKIDDEKDRLKSFLWREDVHTLSDFELAFIIILERDFNSSSPKIFTPSLIQQVKNRFADYHEGTKTEFNISPSGVVQYPTDLSNKWSISIDGQENEIVTVDFDRWEPMAINLSD